MTQETKTYPYLGNFHIHLSDTGDRLDFSRRKRNLSGLGTILANSLGHPLIESIQALPTLTEQCRAIDAVIDQLYAHSKRAFFERRGDFTHARQWPQAVESAVQEYQANQSAIADAKKIRDELDVNQGDRVANCERVISASHTIQKAEDRNNALLNHREVTADTEMEVLRLEAKREFFTDIWRDLYWPLTRQEENNPHKCDWLPATETEPA